MKKYFPPPPLNPGKLSSHVTEKSSKWPEGVRTYNFLTFSEKLPRVENISVGRGGGHMGTLPHRSVNGVCLSTLLWSHIHCSGGSSISQRRAPTPEGDTNLLFDQFFTKTAWKLRNFGTEEGTSLASPRSALWRNYYFLFFFFLNQSILIRLSEVRILWPNLGNNGFYEECRFRIMTSQLSKRAFPVIRY